jgi:hypothetical protein
VCIAAGGRGKLVLQNFRGTSTSPITFINSGGQVVFNGTSDFAIKVQNSRYFRVTGTGDSRYQYGFYINGTYSAGFNAGWKSSDLEVDHIEVANTHGNKGGGPGMFLNTEANCSDGSDNDYDYDADGKVIGDLDDVVTQANFIQYNTRLHHNYVHNSGGEAFYIGSNRTVYASYGQPQTPPCPDNNPAYPLHPVLNGLWVYSNRIAHSGWDSVNVKGTPKECYVYDNVVTEDSAAQIWEQAGINIGLNSKCDVYRNQVKDGFGTGIRSSGIGGNIYNNLVINPGRGYPVTDKRGSGIMLELGTVNNSFHVWNNSIINPKSYGIDFDYEFGSDNRIQNNIVVNPGAYSDVRDNSYVFKCSRCSASISANLKTLIIGDAKFVNPTIGDYSLLSTSPAVDAGINLSSNGITDDLLGVARPQGTTYDMGAYEFVSVSSPAIPTGLRIVE